MRRRGAQAGIFANPVLVGAVTVLVTLVAVFLAYNANNGLPFVPTTTMKVRLTDGANLVKGNEVRSGGYRVGVIQAMEPIELPDGTVGAELTLKLDKSLEEIPRDSTAVVRPRSALGLKYLDLREGRASEAFADGETMQADRTEVPVDLDRVFEMFDRRTREAAQRNLEGFGDSFTGRGQDLGRTIEELPGFFGHLEAVMNNLAAPETDLKSFFKELGDTARVVAPVAKEQSRLFTTMADTWEAVGRDEGALKELISKSPPTMDVAIESFPVQRAFLDEFAKFSEELQPATRALRAALPTINRAVEVATPVQRRMVDMNQRLEGSLGALQELTEAPGTLTSLRALEATADTLNPQLRFYGPFITVCNYWNTFWTYTAEHFAEEDVVGGLERAMINTVGRQDDSLGSMGANAPANGRNVQEGGPQHLHAQDFGRAVNEKGEADCEIGQRGYLHSSVQFLGPEWHIARDPRQLGDQGTTWTGRPRVPAGQTFDALPSTGPYAAPNLPLSDFGER